jgi:hypothetical protein
MTRGTNLLYHASCVHVMIQCVGTNIRRTCTRPNKKYRDNLMTWFLRANLMTWFLRAIQDLGIKSAGLAVTIYCNIYWNLCCAKMHKHVRCHQFPFPCTPVILFKNKITHLILNQCKAHAFSRICPQQPLSTV